MNSGKRYAGVYDPNQQDWDVIPTSWFVAEKTIRWPRRNQREKAKAMENPGKNWLTVDINRVEHLSSEAVNYNNNLCNTFNL